MPTLYDISGSKSFYDKADVGITVYRNFKTGLTTVYVQKVKFKHLGEVGMQNFKYFKDNSRFCTCDESGNLTDSRDLKPYPYVDVQPQQQAISWGNNSFEDEGESDLPF